ncbi:sigma-54-dependent transcriptional regulator [Desulfoferula mesophila]|uniref:Acetoacetate metabolism regulatory protein AtoC n=1 Tax=Desulfoferula mesophila TaxID=3058419 RepID=A0AAU9EEN8_9BACT|nr:acetoacetate metabolism regulatory protein AtoC [Desulfoferula mesophilus]
MSDAPLPRVKPHARVLVVEDDADSSLLFAALMESEGHEAVKADSGEEALELLAQDSDFDLVLLDLVLPGVGGWEVLERIKTDGKLRYVPVVVLSALDDKATTIKALELGAEDFLSKPVDVERMLSRVRVMLRIRSLYEDLIHERSGRQHAQRSLEMRRYFGQVMGGSSQVQQLADVLENVVDTDATVLLEGESGTGKGLLAESVHRFSRRSQGPMVVVNCSAYPETLLSSELFGHEKGAFTGAIRRKPGRFELAHGGTIFLDEIAEISPLTQLTLLRVIQDHQFERVGGEKTLTVDVRVLAATNKPLAGMVEKGLFREDLFYRLNVVRLEVPSLRTRPEDIPFLANSFLNSQAEKLGKAIYGFEREALTRLMSYGWPGNVRELKNVVEHAALMCREDVICLANLPARLADDQATGATGLAAAPVGRLWDNEREIIAHTLERVNWNKYRAAQVLGIARSTLYGKIKKHGLTPPAGSEASQD